VGYVLRLDHDGLPEAGFGTDGVAALGFDDPDRIFEVRDLAVLPSGRVVVAANTNVYEPVLALLEPDGTPALDFGEAGIVLTGLGTRGIGAVAVDGADRVLLGAALGSAPMVARFDAAGRPDASFGDEGVVTLPFDGYVRAVVAQGDRVVALGEEEVGDQERAFWVRLGPDGAVEALERNPRLGASVLDVAIIPPDPGGEPHEAWVLQCTEAPTYCDGSALLRARF
jgi:hypothetical protein